MRPKHLIILGVVFLLLLATFVLKQMLAKPPVEQEEYKSLQILVRLTDIYTIEIQGY